MPIRDVVFDLFDTLVDLHMDDLPLVTLNGRDKVRQAIDVLQEYGISQAPVVREPSDDVTQVVGSIQERALLDRIFRDPDALQADVPQVMGPPLPMVEAPLPCRSVKRSASASPATGSAKAHELEQSAILELAFAPLE